ncbi:2-hydroxycarboxylate transporter family protein [Candidatus Phytoplasma solani]|uniref:Malate/citrate symporter n=1 Tax=Candidatus Phytoplasma solani TaxID=69896 RepID=A0A421NUV4_9MOLU|nr:2-hydroxycarboxylate transporter family protein [Candidatus Phytoplasma solani]RMI87694.1 malate/citrate symporter [Candidatus Phytoplasma solani]
MNLSANLTENKKNTIPKKTILGFSIPVFCIIVAIVLIQLVGLPLLFSYASKTTKTIQPSTHPFITPLLIAILLAAILQAIGKNTPILKDIGGGAILCIIVPSILFTVQFFKKNSFFASIQSEILNNFKHLSGDKGIGFTTFFVSALIIGSFLGMDTKLLKNSFKKFIPLIFISLITGMLVVGTLGYFLNPIKGLGLQEPDITSKRAFLDSIFYIFAPLASGGLTAGIVPLSNAYGSSFDHEVVNTMKSHIFPALLVGGIFSILLSGVIKKLFGQSQLSGSGKLETTHSSPNQQEKKTQKTPDSLNYTQFITGLVSIFTLYIMSVLIKDLLTFIFPTAAKYFPDTIVFIVFVVVLVKLFNLISQYYITCITQASKFITVNFTSALLVILGSTLEISKALVHLQNLKFIITCLVCVLSVALVAGYFGKKLGYYPLEASITAGLCTNSIGGAGNIAILSSSDLMGLMPFAQIATRIGGAFIVVVSSIAYPLIYK